MKFLLSVYAPEIVSFSKRNVSDCKHPREHGMVLVIVAMKSVATDRLAVFQRAQIFLDNGQIVTILRIIDWIGLGNAKDTTVLDIPVARQTNAIQFPFRQFDQLSISQGPQGIPLCAEVFQSEAGLVRVRYHLRTPVLKV